MRLLKPRLGILLLLLLGQFTGGVNAQVLQGNAAKAVFARASAALPGKYSAVPEYIQLNPADFFDVKNYPEWLAANFKLPANSGFKILNTEPDNLGYVHYRLQQTVNGIPVEGTMFLLHTKNGQVVSMNGELINQGQLQKMAVLSETEALAIAVKEIGADKYMWQLAGADKQLKATTGNADATYFPKGELVYVSNNHKPVAEKLHLAYVFDIYAIQPLSRTLVYIDAITGSVVLKLNRIETDVNAIAQTQFSGNRAIVTDNYNGSFRLRESGRGNGIQTFNLHTTTNIFSASDFTNLSTTWNTVNAQLDQYAPDAHLASEATYDFYKNNFGRNSLNNNGLKLVAYVHYDSNLQNAFWDGTAMNYGDGNSSQGIKPFTSLEIGGHEITHGLTQYTASLEYEGESGALNESFSDCMGTAIRQSILQSPNVDYLIGDQLGIGTTFRSMKSPKIYQQPNTYMGTYWYSGSQDNGGVHTNSGVQNYWFYLVSHGGSGTNDNGDSYNITGIGIDKASAITYRNLTTYLTPTAQYAEARTYSIQAAIDLYGLCSPEVAAVTNAWYAVGVGDTFSSRITASFSENVTSLCAAPGDILFTNTSVNGENYLWDFGDGETSTQLNPMHTYASYGNYTVKLIISSACGTDSLVETNLIALNNTSPAVAGAYTCKGQSALLSGTSDGLINWYLSPIGGDAIGTGDTFTTAALNHTTTYYAETQIERPINTCGPPDTAFGTGSIFTNTNRHQIYFNCTAPQKLVSVDVYSDQSGSRIISLFDSSGAVLRSTTISIAAGMHTINLDYDLPVANNMSLALNGVSHLYRHKTGATFPYYSTDGTVVLTNTDAGSSFYYYFYNWKLQVSPCISARRPVVVTVLDATPATFVTNISSNAVNFAPTNDGLNCFWDFGDGTTSTEESPTHLYGADGTFTVTLIQSNGSCSDTGVADLKVTLATGISQISQGTACNIYPNPAQNQLTVAFTALANTTAELIITNLLGEIVFAENIAVEKGANNQHLNVQNLPAAMYLVSLKTGGSFTVKPFVKSE